MLVTFRFRGEARSVRLRGSLESVGDTELRFKNGEWTLTLDLPSDLRAAYWFGLDGEDDWKGWLPDPANPNRYIYFAVSRPDVFGNALVQAGGFPGQPVKVRTGLPLRRYLDVGTFDGVLLESTRRLRDDLRAAGMTSPTRSTRAATISSGGAGPSATA